MTYTPGIRVNDPFHLRVKIRRAWWLTPLIWVIDTLPVPERLEGPILRFIAKHGVTVECE